MGAKLNPFTGKIDLTGNSAPTDAKYIVQTANSSLSAEQALSALATGIVKNTTTTGVLSIATAGTDYIAGFTPSRIVMNTGNGNGAVNTKIRILSNVQSSAGSDITRATSANDGDSYTINTTGYYSIDYSDVSSVSCTIALSVNSNQLTTSAVSITAAHLLSIATSAGNSQFAFVHWDGPLTAGDVIRMHGGGTAPVGTSGAIKFDIKRVY